MKEMKSQDLKEQRVQQMGRGKGDAADCGLQLPLVGAGRVVELPVRISQQHFVLQRPGAASRLLYQEKGNPIGTIHSRTTPPSFTSKARSEAFEEGWLVNGSERQMSSQLSLQMEGPIAGSSH